MIGLFRVRIADPNWCNIDFRGLKFSWSLVIQTPIQHIIHVKLMTNGFDDTVCSHLSYERMAVSDG